MVYSLFVILRAFLWHNYNDCFTQSGRRRDGANLKSEKLEVGVNAFNTANLQNLRKCQELSALRG